MNYLAHSFLSFNQTEILFGNLIADFVKGNQKNNFSFEIQQGILLHKEIDRYTDNHILIKKSIETFNGKYKLGSGIFIDIFFDHFLANDVNYFTEESLLSFTKSVYENIATHEHLLNDKMKLFFSYMQQYNWLFHYKSMDGLTKSIVGICKKYPKLGNPEIVLLIFKQNYDELKNNFEEFFPELIDFSLKKIEEIKNS